MYEKYWKLHGGVDAISNRADGVGNSLLALGAQYGWQLAGMMLIGAALMRSGWLKGQFSLRHYRRTGFVLVAIGVIINLPAIALQWRLDWAYRWCAFLLQMPRELSAPFQAIGYASLFYGFWPQLSRFKLVLAIACVGRMALTNYLLQTLICTTLFTTSVCLCILTARAAGVCYSGMAGEYPLLCYLAAFLPPWAGGMALASVNFACCRTGNI